MSESSTPLIDAVMAMEMAGVERRWDDLKSFFTDDVYFKVGTAYTGTGPDAIVNYLKPFYENFAEPNLPFTFRGTWEVDNGTTAVVEMDAHYIRLFDRKPIFFPCCDVLRFRDGKIYSWCVYPDQAQLHVL